MALAGRYGISSTTVQMWRRRTHVVLISDVRTSVPYASVSVVCSLPCDKNASILTCQES
jgi:hypothetical protein